MRAAPTATREAYILTYARAASLSRPPYHGAYLQATYSCKYAVRLSRIQPHTGLSRARHRRDEIENERCHSKVQTLTHAPAVRVLLCARDRLQPTCPKPLHSPPCQAKGLRAEGSAGATLLSLGASHPISCRASQGRSLPWRLPTAPVPLPSCIRTYAALAAAAPSSAKESSNARCPTTSPSVAWTESTVASIGARIVCSIFIASSTTRASPAATAWPLLTSTRTILPGIGE